MDESGRLTSMSTTWVPFQNLSGQGGSLEGGWLYHTPAWERTLVEGFGVRSGGLVTRADDQVIADLPVFWLSRLGFKVCGSPLRGLFTEFQGPRFRPDLSHQERRHVIGDQLQTLRRMGFRYVEFGSRADGSEDGGEVFSDLTSKGCKYEARLSLVVDLREGPERAWKSFEGRARNMVRKAVKKGVEVKVAELEARLLRNYLTMVSDTFRHQGLTMPHPPTAFEALARNIGRSGNLLFVAAEHSGELVSGGIFLLHRDRMMFLSGSSSSEGMSLAASSLVQWKAIQEGYERGVREYDMGGIGVRSIDRFKEGFGGERVRHHRWTYMGWPLRQGAGAAEWLARKGLLRVFR